MTQLEEAGFSSSTPVKEATSTAPEPMANFNGSVDDLLLAIDKNISSTSLNYDEDSGNLSASFNTSDEPIKPLNLKPLSTSLEADTEEPPHTDKESLMENIPRAPSFDELEFNTKLNRASSISRLSGPRQLANSSLSRTFSNNLGRSSSFRSSAPATRDNSPSKKSVCFEESPPKIVEYDEFTPENSDHSVGEEDDTFESKWDGKLKASDHPLPPPPPKHQVMTPSPQKDTTLGSSDEDTQDFNLTKEDLQNHSVTLEERLDLVLGSDEVSKRIQEDEVNRGSGSPQRPLTKSEKDLILSIKSKEELAEEDNLRAASELFEQDLRNTDKSSRVLRLDPVLRRKNSNNSLRDEERELSTSVVSQTKAPITLIEGLKNTDLDKLPPNEDIVNVSHSNISQSTLDSFASATDIFESEPIEPVLKKEHQSSNSISTLRGDDEVKSHKKKLSLSESINSFISAFGKSPKKDVAVKQEFVEPVVPGAFITAAPAPEVKDSSAETSPRAVDAQVPELLPSAIIEPTSAETSQDLTPTASQPLDTPVAVEEVDDVISIQSSIEAATSEVKAVSPVEHESLLENSSPVLLAESSGLMDDILLRPGILNEQVDDELSFADEFKETGLYNSSDRMNEDYRSAPRVAVDAENVLDDLENDDDDVVEVESIPETAREMEPEVAAAPKANIIRQEVVVTPEVEARSPMLKSPQDDPLERDVQTHDIAVGTEDIGYTSSAVQAGPLEIEVGVQTDDVFGDLKPALETSDFEEEDENDEEVPQRAKGAIPSFESTLFQDKDPQEEVSVHTPPTSYIDIWHSLPKPSSPQPQYSLGSSGPLGSRSVTPETVLRRLSTRRSKHDKYEKITLDSTQLKKEDGVDRKRLSLLKEDSFVATSISQSSFIKVESRNTSVNLDSSFVESSNILANSSGLALPDISNSSDFAGAFKEWDVSQSKDADRSMKLEEMKKSASTTDEIRAIWGSNMPPQTEKSRTPSVEVEKIENIIALTDTNGEVAQMKSSDAQGEVIVTRQEDPGIEIEYDQASLYNVSDHKPLALAAHSAQAPKQQQRILSHGSEFDLGDEFERAVKQRIPSSPTVEHKVENRDILDEAELQKPMVPEVDNLHYMKTRSKKTADASPQKPQGPRVRTPLAALADSDLNKVDSRKSSVYTQRVLSQPISENYEVGENVALHKRDSRMSMYHDSLAALQDKGRLYIHINSLSDIQLDQIHNHKASFRLYLDNGKHTIATPKMDLSNHVEIDKEFEVAIDEDVTDLFFTFKIAYQRPENELVEVYEKIPLKNNRLSRLIGVKPKYKVQKSWETRKREKDNWDNKFANDGSFGKNKISFFATDNEITSQTQNYVIELFNEWETQMQAGKEYKKPPHLIAKMDVTMLYLPRTSPLETLPPSIHIAQTVAGHIAEQSNTRFEGFLFQEGGDCDLWKRRFFKLEGTKLIAHHDVTKKPRALINLLKVVDILHNGKKKAEGQRNFTDEILMSDGFKLKFKNGEIITFNAETKELKDQWIEVLEKVVGFNKFHQPWVKSLAQNQR